jgi:hypothetical protein
LSAQIRKLSIRLRLTPPKPRTPLDDLIEMRSDYRRLAKALSAANDLAIQDRLAGQLDTGGHHVEVREKIIGGEIIKILLIDGKS